MCRRRGAIKKVTPVTELFIVSQVLEHPGIMLHELQAVLIEQAGVAVDLSTIYLHKVSHELLVRGERISAIAFMSMMSGMLDCKTVKPSVNGETFYQFMQAIVRTSSPDDIQWSKPTQCSYYGQLFHPSCRCHCKYGP